MPREILQGNGVTKYFGGVHALEGFDFSMNEGEILGLIGPNGSGKTTLFNVITGVYPLTKGKVIFEDKPIQNLSINNIAAYGISRTFQNVRLFKRLTVLMNVMIGAHLKTQIGLLPTVARTSAFRTHERKAKEIAYQWLNYVGLEHRANEIARSLPYGEQKLLELARALAADPKLLLLDEPAAGLNPNEVSELATLIRRLRETNLPIFVVEHNMHFIMGICDRIMVINFGKKIAEGSPMKIQENIAVQEAYLGSTGD